MGKKNKNYKHPQDGEATNMNTRKKGKRALQPGKIIQTPQQ